MATAENQFFIWAENDSTDQRQSLSKSVENVSCGITTEIKSDLIKSEVKDTTKISGIYKILNKINGKYYVGSSKDIRTRWWHHRKLLKKNKHHSKYLQRSWNKYGKDAFEFAIIEKGIPEKDLLTTEQKYLDIAKQERSKAYNECFEAEGGSKAGWKHTKEAIEKIKAYRATQIFSLERNQKLSKSLTGKKLSEKTKNKLSALLSGINHPGSDKTIYTFHNTLTNEDFAGTRYDFYTKFGINKSEVCYLVSGKRNKKHIGNWILKHPVRAECKSRNDKTSYTFRNLQTNEIFIGTRSDFRKLHSEIPPSNIHYAIKENRVTLGWTISVTLDTAHG